MTLRSREWKRASLVDANETAGVSVIAAKPRLRSPRARGLGAQAHLPVGRLPLHGFAAQKGLGAIITAFYADAAISLGDGFVTATRLAWPKIAGLVAINPTA